jgi:L,D-peptidoglycan transpeptidase YkuD (ErfK/YbiS/YcfS/YnhG family)
MTDHDAGAGHTTVRRTVTMRTVGMRAAVSSVTAAAAAVLLAGCGGGSGGGDAAPGSGGGSGERSGSQHAAAVTRTLPGVGRTLTARVPAAARQAIVVYGASPTTSKSTVAFFTRDADGWHRGPSWPSHNAIHGWTVQHHEDDLKSPVGVFTLHDAGGLLADPGSKLPYTRSTAFTPDPSWPASYQHDFDYVIAIDYNRRIGTSPSDFTRPQGEAKGGSIWIHLDHGVGTSACVTVDRNALRYLLRTLDPSAHPVIVMGDIAHLKR